jgi:hypothetical protein
MSFCGANILPGKFGNLIQFFLLCHKTRLGPEGVLHTDPVVVLPVTEIFAQDRLGMGSAGGGENQAIPE